ncbi:D-aminopeptidase [Paracoccus sp. (in: a-proteobacteria)]|uniref:D-aminopeptidase n=1 Tax=Paracoccus sp. TaxID=267 RepID=UPI0028A04D1E|nr:D-aminopeptidase [Paracoccus sp. (in: a-proteobacteria)]
MPGINLDALEHALDLLANQYRGPGGVAGVVKDGKVIARRVWGYADMNARKPMLDSTRLPICSISKQMTCALLLDMFDTPEVLDPLLPTLLPHLKGQMPQVAELCHNQSGLRDYWALTVLHGAVPEAIFTREDGLRLLQSYQSTHFTPGMHYSYSNGNFRLLAELIERASGRDFGELLAERIFAPAGMSTACLAADTSKSLDGVVGYEGNHELGFLPAGHGIYWFGDAGISASLNDMLAWECHIDATRNDPNSLYNRISAPVSFADGTPADYGYGLRHDHLCGRQTTGHAGALRGFSSYRMHVAAERLSIYVNFNHESGAIRAAWQLAHAALGQEPSAPSTPEGNWNGLWMDQDNGLFLRTKATPSGVKMNYMHTPQMLTTVGPDHAKATGLDIMRKDGTIHMRREGENLTVTALPVEPIDLADGCQIAGRYRSAEMGTEIEITSAGGGTYIGFSGTLGQGPMERVYPLAADLWSVPTRRSMDAAPPGEWTLQIRRDQDGKVNGLVIGCWLARNIEFERV